jgi:hypothetical protein
LEVPENPKPLATAMSLVVQPSARERFTSRELIAAYEDFNRDVPQYVDAGTGIKAATYRFGMRVLFVYEESETGLVVFLHPASSSPRRRSILRTSSIRRS